MLAPGDIAYPLRKIAAEHDSLTAHRRDVVAVDPVARSVTTASGETFTGDYLVLAAGSQPSFFGTPGAEHAFPLYSLDDAERLRTRIIQAFEEADWDAGKGRRRRDHVRDRGRRPDGGRGRRCPVRDDRDHDGPRVPQARAQGEGVPRQSRRCAPRDVRRQGAQVHRRQADQGRRRAAHGPEGDGDRTRSREAVRRPRDPNAHGDLGRRPDGGTRSPGPAACRRVAADGSTCSRTSRWPAFPASSPSATSPTSRDKDGKTHPQLGSVALQSGGAAAKTILADLEGKPAKPFHYLDKGTMAMIGRGAAIAQVPPGVELHGKLAFAAWLGVHAALMTGGSNRVDAFKSWAVDFFGKERAPQALDRSGEPRMTVGRRRRGGSRASSQRRWGMTDDRTYDVIIIGSGAGGGTLAGHLAPIREADPPARTRRLAAARDRELGRRRGLRQEPLRVEGHVVRRQGQGLPARDPLLRRRPDQVLWRRPLSTPAGGLRGAQAPRRHLARVAHLVRGPRAVLLEGGAALRGPRQPRRGSDRAAVEHGLPLPGGVARAADPAAVR